MFTKSALRFFCMLIFFTLLISGCKKTMEDDLVDENEKSSEMEKKFKIGAPIQDGLGDRSFADMTYIGLAKAEQELGVELIFDVGHQTTISEEERENSIQRLIDQKVDLIITVDCGITAVEEIDYANSFSIDTIICDHHQPKEVLPKAYAILDPLKPGCEYPFKYLSGAGVAFKLARAIAYRFGKKDMVFKYLDLVALAGAADIVPLIDENRILAHSTQ